MERVTSVRALPGYRLWLRFTDGVEGEVDLSPLVGRGVFSSWEDEESFQAVGVSDSGAPEWPGEIDLCPDSLYLQLTGKTWEDLEPSPGQATSA
jgi:hypothetical protein